MGNLRAAVVGETIFCVSNNASPEAASWDQYMVLLGEHMAQRSGKPGSLVVFAGGGTPDASMRLKLRQTVNERPLITSVVTDSVMVRGIIGVFSLFVGGTKPFAGREWKASLEYAGFPVSKLSEALPVLRQLDADVGGCSALGVLLKEGK